MKKEILAFTSRAFFIALLLTMSFGPYQGFLLLDVIFLLGWIFSGAYLECIKLE